MSVAADLLREAADVLESNRLGPTFVRALRAQALVLDRAEERLAANAGDRRAARTNAEVAAGIVKGDRSGV